MTRVEQKLVFKADYKLVPENKKDVYSKEWNKVSKEEMKNINK